MEKNIFENAAESVEESSDLIDGVINGFGDLTPDELASAERLINAIQAIVEKVVNLKGISVAHPQAMLCFHLRGLELLKQAGNGASQF